MREPVAHLSYPYQRFLLELYFQPVGNCGEDFPQIAMMQTLQLNGF
jgi:hypothetical protein